MPASSVAEDQQMATGVEIFNRCCRLRSMRAYYLRWLKSAFTHSLGPIDLWTGIAGAVLAVVDHYLPALQLMSSLGWQVAIWALAAVMLVRLVLAPYWMAEEDASTIKKLEAARLTKEKIQSTKNALAAFLEEGRAVVQRCANESEPAPETEAQDWLNRLLAYLAAADGLGLSYVARVNSHQGIPIGMTSIQSKVHRNISSNVGYRLARLHEFLAELRPD